MSCTSSILSACHCPLLGDTRAPEAWGTTEGVGQKNLKGLVDSHVFPVKALILLGCRISGAICMTFKVSLALFIGFILITLFNDQNVKHHKCIRSKVFLDKQVD